MPAIHLFFDSSALIAGIVSAQGATRALLLLAEDHKLQMTVTEQVIAEVERSIARKAPKALPFTREVILQANLRILRDPTPDDVRRRAGWTGHAADLPVLVAAALDAVDFLVTLDAKHFLSDPQVSRQSGLRIGMPGDALAWVRERFAGQANTTRED